jgi:hypothetical protein
MKKTTFIVCLIAYALNGFAQGSVVFANRIGPAVLQTHVYLNPSGDVYRHVGNGPGDYPPGNMNWSGFTPLQGADWRAALIVNPGPAQSFCSQTTTFRTGAAAGYLNPITATLPGVSLDAPSVNLAIFVWNNSSGRFNNPIDAWTAWQQCLVCAGGVSPTFTVKAVGGYLNVPPIFDQLQSFSIYAMPEPSAVLIGLFGAGATLWGRRLRKLRR